MTHKKIICDIKLSFCWFYAISQPLALSIPLNAYNMCNTFFSRVDHLKCALKQLATNIKNILLCASAVQWVNVCMLLDDLLCNLLSWIDSLNTLKNNFLSLQFLFGIHILFLGVKIVQFLYPTWVSWVINNCSEILCHTHGEETFLVLITHRIFRSHHLFSSLRVIKARDIILRD